MRPGHHLNPFGRPCHITSTHSADHAISPQPIRQTIPSPQPIRQTMPSPQPIRQTIPSPQPIRQTMPYHLNPFGRPYRHLNPFGTSDNVHNKHALIHTLTSVLYRNHDHSPVTTTTTTTIIIESLKHNSCSVKPFH